MGHKQTNAEQTNLVVITNKWAEEVSFVYSIYYYTNYQWSSCCTIFYHNERYDYDALHIADIESDDVFSPARNWKYKISEEEDINLIDTLRKEILDAVGVDLSNVQYKL